MCGRFTFGGNANAIRAELGLEKIEIDWEASFNIAPTQPLAAVVQRDNKRTLTTFRWGLIPHWAKDPAIGSRLINARAETLAAKPSFREAFKFRRCLVLADGFYEWSRRDGKKQPLYIRMKSKRTFAFAGLWERWVSPNGVVIESATIITVEPNTLVKRFHNRMALIVDPGDYRRWLDPEIADPAALQSLLVPYPPQQMEAYWVSSRVNKPQNNDPSLIEPLDLSREPVNLSFDFD